MRTNYFFSLGVIIVTVLLIGYAIFATSPSKSELDARVGELTPASEKKPINTKILEEKNIKAVQEFKIFGKRPVSADPTRIDRGNPFEGI